MVALNQKRFNSTDDKTGELRNGAKNVNTGKTSSFWLSVWKTWCEGKSIALELKEHEPAERNSTNSTPKWKKKKIFQHLLHAKFFTFPLSTSNHTV